MKFILITRKKKYSWNLCSSQGEPNNDSPLNTHAAELWANKVFLKPNAPLKKIAALSLSWQYTWLPLKSDFFLYQVQYKKYLLEKYEKDQKAAEV